MSEQNLITVAIPTYQRDDYLRDALESVLAQSLTRLEIFVSDNANSPATRILVDSYRDRRVTYTSLQSNIGLHGNLTRCLHLGSAPCVALLLDDDTMYPLNLEKKLALLDEYPTAAVAHSAFDYIDQDGRITDRNIAWTGGLERTTDFETGSEFIRRTMETGNRIATSSALIRRPAIEGLGHDSRDNGFSELGLWLRIATVFDFAFSHESLTTVRLHASSVSSELGLHDPIGREVSLFTFPMARGARSAKLRFIRESAMTATERSSLERVVKECARNDLKDIIGPEALRKRDPVLTIRRLFLAAQIEPSILLSPWSYVILASSVIGRRIYDAAVDLRARSRL